MKIEFTLRIPGKHTTLPIVELDAVPRVGEDVILSDDEACHEVHRVTHDTVRNVVCVLLRV
jgi:hypothetical protein